MKDKWIIEIEYGSEFQKRVLQGSLNAMCKALRYHAHNSHKKNAIKWTRTEEWRY